MLPFSPPQEPALPRPEFPPAGPALQSPFELEATQSWRTSREMVQRSAALESESQSRYQLRDGGTVTYRHWYTAEVSEMNPKAASIRFHSDIEVKKRAGTVTVRTMGTFTPSSVSVHAEIVKEDGTLYRRDWVGSRATNTVDAEE
jgi:hypothetical protein